MSIKNLFVILAVVTACLAAASAFAAPVSFTGAYTENFDSMGITMPAGYRAMNLAGAKTLYNLSNPITATVIAGATQSADQTLNGPYAYGSGGTQTTPDVNGLLSYAVNWRKDSSLANQGSYGDDTNRTLASGPTGSNNAATVIELGLTNNTGGPINSVQFAYEMKCLTYGNWNNSTSTETGELPGFSFFYSTDGTNWTGNGALSLGSLVPGTTLPGSATLNFTSPLADGSTMYFRWADDNANTPSPDQNYAIDNVSVNTVPEPSTIALLIAGGLGFAATAFRRRK
jgi:hypothetical protein